MYIKVKLKGNEFWFFCVLCQWIEAKDIARHPTKARSWLYVYIDRSFSGIRTS